MKVYMVYCPEPSMYSYDGNSWDVSAVFLDKLKADAYIKELNSKIRDKREHAYVEPIETRD